MNVSGMKNPVVDVLPSHQSESGMVTREELDLAERWAAAVMPKDKANTSENIWLDNWLWTGLPFRFKYGDRESASLLSQWRLEERTEDADSNSVRQQYVWTDEATGLQVIWQVKRFLHCPAVEWLLTFENTGAGDTPVLQDIQALDLRLNHSRPGQSYTVHGANGGRSLRDDLMPFSWSVPFLGYMKEEAVELGGTLLSSDRHLPFFNIETPEGKGVLVGVGWSGTWLAHIRSSGTELAAAVGLKDASFVLHPGEKVRTARILLVFWKGQRLHGHNILRQLLHQHYVPPLRGKPQEPLVAANVGFAHHTPSGAYLDEQNEEGVLAALQPIIDVGAELCIIDAGWYEGTPWYNAMGNWRISKAQYPRGFRPIAKALSAANVDFGLWFAPELVNRPVPPPDNQADWVAWNEQGAGRKWPPEFGRLRLELPEARQWFLQRLEEIIENEGITCYRTDMSPQSYDDPPGDRKGITESRHIEGLYALWDAIAKRHPDLIMEGCCGGGRRIDLETIRRFHWIQKSDRCFDPESDQCGLYGANLFLPGGFLILYTAATDDYGAWSSFAGLFSIAWKMLDADFPMAQAQRQVARYKKIRHLLSGDFYPLTPCSLTDIWMGYQFHRLDLDEGVAFLFRRPAAKEGFCPATENFHVHLRGLDPKARYLLHFERSNQDKTLKGKDLQNGIELTISDAPGAEMITYSPAK